MRGSQYMGRWIGRRHTPQQNKSMYLIKIRKMKKFS
jgi:hypothetical protein